MPNNRKLKTPPNRTRRKAAIKIVRDAKPKPGDIVGETWTAEDVANSDFGKRADTDDPSQMMPAEAACGPLVDPILEDEDDSDDETPGFGDTP